MTTNSTTASPLDRRRRKRLLTLKNTTRVLVVALILFAGVSIASEFRGRRSAEMGRLYRNRPKVAQLPPVAPKVVVREAPAVPDTDFADPLTAESMQREQYLGVTGKPLDPRSGVEIGTEYSQDYRPAEPLALKVTGDKKGKARFAIEGGAAGVYTKLD